MPNERYGTLRHPSDGSTGAIVEFCRLVRDQGFNLGVTETLGAVEAAHAVAITDGESLKFALRGVLCSSREEWDRFDDLFDAFWSGSGRQLEPAEDRRKEGRFTEAKGRKGNSVVWLLGRGNDGASSEEEEGREAMSGASVHERLRKTDFSNVPQHDLAALEQLSLRLVRRMSLRLSRRLNIARSQGRVDLRRTIRRSIGRGGDPIELSYKGRKTRPARLVLLLDVSGSMDLYSLFLLKFVYALQRHFKRVDSFIFSTRLVNVTDALRAQHLPEALMALSQRVKGWSGGTKIGQSLREFNDGYGKKLLSHDTLFVMLSDGWDTGEPEILAEELRKIQRRVRKLIWLNPLLGLDNYQPITRGVNAALPFIDVFAPAHNLESLLELERHLHFGHR